MFNLTSKKTFELSQNLKKKIFLLKKSSWNYSLKNQDIWFKNNVFNNDIHNLFFLKNELIGYTLLRKRTFEINKNKKKYFYFDTMVIKKKFQKLGFTIFLMNFNIFIIKKNNLISFLMCKKKLIKFYEKFYWKKLHNKNFEIIDSKKKKYLFGMIFEKKLENKLTIFINK
jgi:hypothetical protein